MMLAMFAGENRDDWDDLLPVVMMAYRSSVNESMGYSPYQLMFGEECTFLMDVGLPRQESDLPNPITSPYAVWVRDALEVAYNQVHRNSNQTIRRQKRLYDRRAVRRMFTVGDRALRYYSPAKKCKLDSAWVGPYLVVSLAGWAVGIQLPPDSPIILVHCQDLKKIPRPSGLVSWNDVARPVGVPTLPVLGASTMSRTTQGSPSIAVLPTEEGAALSEIASVKSAQLPSGSRTCRPEASGMDVLSSALSSAVVFFPHGILLVDATSVLHPFFTHRLDAGPIRLTTIAHAFNYRVAVLRDGVKSAARVGRSRRAEGRFLEDTLLCFKLCLHWPWKCLHIFRILENCGVCHLMYNYPVNHGDIRTIMVGVANAFPRTVWVLMFTVCLSYPGRVCLG